MKYKKVNILEWDMTTPFLVKKKWDIFMHKLGSSIT